jgi:hypothetical protein
MRIRAQAPEWLTRPIAGSVRAQAHPRRFPMSRSKAQHRTRNVATSAWRRAREAAVRLQPAAGKVTPLAKNSAAAARHRADRTRAWAAPQVDRVGRVVEESVAPKVSALLSAAARRLEPDKPRRRRWRLAVGVSAATAGAGAFAAAVRSRLRASAAAAAEEDHEEAGRVPAAETAPVAEATPAEQTGNGQRGPGRDVVHDSGTRTS